MATDACEQQAFYSVPSVPSARHHPPQPSTAARKRSLATSDTAMSPVQLARSAGAELVGTALLVWGSCALAAGVGRDEPATQALATGALVAMLVQCLDHISGAQMNPCVSLASAAAGRMSWARVSAHIPAQLAGSVLGAGLARLLATHAHTHTHQDGGQWWSCVTQPGADVGGARAALMEGVLSALLVLANLAHWDARAASAAHSWPLRLGTTVAALGAIGGVTSGASMNPARSVGPAVFASCYRHHWVYWVGPLSGTAAALLVHRALSPPPT